MGLTGVRDRTVLLFGWGARVGTRLEITGATVENLTRLDDDTFVYRLHNSKTRAGRHAGRPECV